MKLEDLIPDNDINWVIKNNKIYYKKGEHSLALMLENDIIYVIIDIKIYKKTVKLIKNLMDLNIKFYLINLNQHKLIENDFNIHMIRSYLYTYINKEYFYGFKKINFDLISNLVEWAKDNNCIDKIKECYDSIKSIVNTNYYDYYSNRYIYDYEEEIRDSYHNIYRDIYLEIILK